MSNNASLLQQAKNTEVSTDHSEVSSGGGRRLPEVGKCPARLIGYVELGTHPQPAYKGKDKPPAMEVQLTFECFGKQNMDTFDGDDGKSVTHGRIIRPLPIAVKLNERAKFYKMFQDMDYGRGLDHMSKMLNDVFRLDIKHETSKNGTEYAYIDAIESPLVEITDDMGNVEDYMDISEKCPPATYDLQLFIFEKPSFEQWESIFIEGTYDKKSKDKDGNEIVEEVSKNLLQMKIEEALDWEGSPMQTLLLGLEEETPEEAPKKEEKTAPKKTPAKKTKKSVGPAAEEKTSTKSEDDGSADSATKSPSEETPDDEDARLAELGL